MAVLLLTNGHHHGTYLFLVCNAMNFDRGSPSYCGSLSRWCHGAWPYSARLLGQFSCCCLAHQCKQHKSAAQEAEVPDWWSSCVRASVWSWPIPPQCKEIPQSGLVWAPKNVQTVVGITWVASVFQNLCGTLWWTYGTYCHVAICPLPGMDQQPYSNCSIGCHGIVR